MSQNCDIVGLMMGCLDDKEAAQVRKNMGSDPELARHATQLQCLMDLIPRESFTPPPQLAQRTIARLEQARLRNEAAITTGRSGWPAWSVGSWRMADLLAGTAIMGIAVLVAFPSINKAWTNYREVACRHTLGTVGQALNQYADQHDDQFPHAGTHGYAGAYFVSLRENGYLPNDFRTRCGTHDTTGYPASSTMVQLRAAKPDEFRHQARRLGGCYSYALGHENGDGIVLGPTRSLGDQAPILADNPPASGIGNSDNHRVRGRNNGGQNVLRVGGDVQFMTERNHGTDDIYLNRNNRVGAGIGSSDTVLGPGDTQP